MATPLGSNSQSERPSAAAPAYKKPQNSIEQPFMKQLEPADAEMKMPQLLVLVSSALVGVSAAFPPDTRALLGQDKYASWDDVNVVAHGLLQLGQGLKEHVDKTKAQTRDVNAKLRSLDATVEEVERRQREQDEALRAGSKEAGDREKLLAHLAEEVRSKVEEVKKQSKNIDSKVDKLEEKLEDGGHVGDSLIQVREAPYLRIKGGGVEEGCGQHLKPVMVFPEDGGGSEQTHRPAGGEAGAAARQAGQAEPPPANAAGQGEPRLSSRHGAPERDRK